MIKYLCMFCVVLLVNCSHDSKKANKDDYVTECPECEIEILKNDAGNIEWEISKLHGVKHGRTRSWWPNKQLSSEKYYLNNEIHGPVRLWDENGKLIVDSYWRNGRCFENCQKENGKQY